MHKVKSQFSLQVHALCSVFTLGSVGSKEPIASSCQERSFSSDWGDAQADQSLQCMSITFVDLVLLLRWHFIYRSSHEKKKKSIFLIEERHLNLSRYPKKQSTCHMEFICKGVGSGVPIISPLDYLKNKILITPAV